MPTTPQTVLGAGMLLLLCLGPANAQEGEGDLAKKLANPISTDDVKDGH